MGGWPEQHQPVGRVVAITSEVMAASTLATYKISPVNTPGGRHTNTPVSAVGRLVREWRTARGLSQLALAANAGFSPRHVSFIETGRTQPSRHSLLTLAEALDMPLRVQNRLLEAGGYAHMFRETTLAAQEMAHVRSVLQFVLDRHMPNAAVVLDRYTNCL